MPISIRNYADIARLLLVRSLRGSDVADRMAMKQFGSVLRAAQKQFWKDPHVIAAGASKRLPHSRYEKVFGPIVRGLDTPAPAPVTTPVVPPPAIPQQPMLQGLFDFNKKADASDALGNPNSIGNILASQLPFQPAGLRRAGVAQALSAGMKDDPGFLVSRPALSQLLAGVGGLGLGMLAGRKTTSVPLVAATILAPLVAVNALRERKVREIQQRYKKLKQQGDTLTAAEAREAVGNTYGSESLGREFALRKMRYPRFRNLHGAADVVDWASLAGWGSGNGLPTFLLTRLADDIHANALRKKASQSWSDSGNNPSLAMFLAATALGYGGHWLASKNFRNRLAESSGKLPRGVWEKLVAHIAGTPNTVVGRVGEQNAYNGRAGQGHFAYLPHTQDMVNWDERHGKGLSEWARQDKARELADKADANGLIGVGPNYDRASIIAHEAGHQSLNNDSGIVAALQKHLYDVRGIASALAPAGALAAGMASGSPVLGALLGALTGGVVNAGTLIPEFEASRRGNAGLRTFEGGRYNNHRAFGDAASAWSTYGAALLLPSILAGTAGGLISKSRRKKEKEDAEAQAKESGKITRIPTAERADEGARKAASLQ